MDGPWHYEQAERCLAIAHADERPNRDPAFVANCMREAAVHAKLAAVAWDVFTASMMVTGEVFSADELAALQPWQWVTRRVDT